MFIFCPQLFNLSLLEVFGTTFLQKRWHAHPPHPPTNQKLKHKGRRKPMVFSSIFIELIQFPLTGIKLIVASLHFEKLLVSTALDDLALLKHHDSI